MAELEMEVRGVLEAFGRGDYGITLWEEWGYCSPDQLLHTPGQENGLPARLIIGFFDGLTFKNNFKTPETTFSIRAFGKDPLEIPYKAVKIIRKINY